MKVDLEDFVVKVKEIGLISQEVAECFKSLDSKVLRLLKIRFLLIHVDEQLELDPSLHESWCDLLSKHGDLSALDPSNSAFSFIYNSKEYDGYFTEKHISDLTELLASRSNTYYNIGVSLNMPSNTLKYITEKFFFQSSVACLRELFSEWIVGGHKYTKRPTVESLKETLRSEIVGLGIVAAKLEKKLVKRGICSEKRIESKQQCGNVTRSKKVPMHKSTLLEANTKACAAHEMTYQWMKGGCSLSDDKYYVGVNKQILYIKDANLASNGIYTCKITESDKTKFVQSECIDLTVDVGEVTKYLICQYTNRMSKANPNEYPPVKDFYINLALIDCVRFDEREFVRCTIQGDMESSMQPSIEYKEAFGEYNTKRFVLIEGRPGSGKTTLVNKISKDWANGEPVLQGADLVFHVSLRVLSEDVEYLDKLIGHRSSEHSGQMVSNPLDLISTGEGVCFILDGLDEYAIVQGSTVSQIIQRKYLPMSMLIVASRPKATFQLRQHADMRIEVLGFNKKQIYKFIEKYHTSEKSKSLKSYLKEHPNILRMCYLPLHTNMISFLYDVNGDLPHTETKIYEEFTRLMIFRNLKRSNENVCQLKLLEDLSLENKRCLKNICKLAFDMTSKSTQVIEQKYLSGQDKQFLGLVTRDSTAEVYGLSNIHTFVHLTFQEFLTAYHISKLEKHVQLKTIYDCSIKDMQVVLKFYCGLQFTTNFVEQASKFEKVLHLHEDDSLFHCQCAFESQQPGACEMVVLSGLAFKDHTFHVADFISIDYVIKNTMDNFHELSICGCIIGDCIEALVETFKLCTNMQHLNLSNNDIDDKISGQLAHCLKELKELQTINLSDNRISSDGVKAISGGLEGCTKLTTFELLGTPRKVSPHFKKRYSEGLEQCLNYKLEMINNFGLDKIATDSAKALASNLSSCDNLQVLKLQWNGIGDEGIVEIVSSLKSDNISVLEFFGSEITSTGVDSFASLLGKCSKLKALDLGLNSISDNGALAISKHLMHCRSLETLKLSFNEFTSTGAEYIADCLRTFNDLQTLDLKWNEIGSQGAVSLANSLKPSIQALNLSRNEIGSEGAIAIAKGIEQMSMVDPDQPIGLKELRLYGNHICMEGAKQLAESLRFCGNLEEFDLCSNNIRNLGAKCISDSLCYCTKLKKLGLSGNKISEVGAEALVNGLHKCKCLQTLDISRNSINDKSAIAFSKGICDSLLELDLSYNQISDKGAEALSKGLKLCKDLQKLGLNNNRIGDTGAQALATLARNLSHCKIGIDNNKLGHVGIKALIDQKMIDLNTVDFSRSNLDDTGIESLAECLVSSKSISLQCNKIGDEGAIALARSLKHCSKLETLYLEHNQIGNDGAKSLAEGLKNCKKLSVLKLTDNLIGDKGAEALAEVLKDCSNFTTLVLKHNQIGDQGAKSLAKSMAHCGVFMIPNLSHNQISSKGAEFLAESLMKCSKLEGLVLTQNQLGNDGAIHLAKILKSCGKFSELFLPYNLIGDKGMEGLAGGLKCRVNFEDLHLAHNKIGDDGAKSLAEGLKKCINFKLLDLEHNQIGDDGAKWLAKGLEHCKNFHQLHLGYNEIGDDGAETLTVSLKHFHVLSLGHNWIGDRGAKGLADGLKEGSNIKSLDLGYNHIGNNGAKDLAEGLKHCRNLKSLNLQHNQISDNGMINVAKSLTLLDSLSLDHNFINDESIKALSEHICDYKHLNLNGNHIGADSASHLFKVFKSLVTLNLGFNSIGDEGVKAMKDGIHHSSLAVLILDHNEVSDEGTEALASALMHHDGLEKLCLEYNNIHRKGAQALSKYLQQCSDLRTLSLKSNMLGGDGVQELAKGLKECSCLQTLNLEHNHIGMASAKGLDDVLHYCSGLETLHLGYNGMSGNGIETLARGLKFCSLLETLNLEHNKIDDKCVSSLADGLKHCSSLKMLSLEYNRIGDSGAEALAECLQSCYNLEDLNLQSNKIGDKGVKALVYTFEHCMPHLEVLNIQSNKIRNDGAKILAEGLKLCIKLETLYLEDNMISEEGITPFCSAEPYYVHIQTLCLDGYSTKISEHKIETLLDSITHCENERVLNLKHLNLCRNGTNILADCLKGCKSLQILKLESSGIDDNGVKIIAKSLSNCIALHTLYLAMNLIGDEGVKELATSLEHCTNIQELNLAQNMISDEGAMALSGWLKNCLNLQELNLERNHISDDGAKTLVQSLKHCRNLAELSLEDNVLQLDMV